MNVLILNSEGQLNQMLEMNIMADFQAWLKARNIRFGGSDAACILGKNPWKTNVQLWEEKSGLRPHEDISEKPFVKYGNAAEDPLRQLFELDFPGYEVKYKANNIWINSEKPFAHASLDGWLIEKSTGRKGILEIKTSNILQSMQKEKWNNQIPDNYYCQVLHYLMVTGWDFVVLKAQLKSEFNGEIYLQTKHYTIERTEVEEDIKYLEDAEIRFWNSLKTGRKPSLILPEI